MTSIHSNARLEPNAIQSTSQESLQRLISRLESRAKLQQQRIRTGTRRDANLDSRQNDKLWWDSVGLLASVNRANKSLEKHKLTIGTRAASSFELQSLEKRLQSISSSVQSNHSSLASSSSLQVPLPKMTSNPSSSFTNSSSSFRSLPSTIPPTPERINSSGSGIKLGPIASGSSSSIRTSNQQLSFKERQAMKRKALLTEGLDFNDENQDSRENEIGSKNQEKVESSLVTIGTSNDGKKIMKRSISNENEDPYDDFIESEDEQEDVELENTTREPAMDGTKGKEKERIPSIKVTNPKEEEQDEFDEYNQAPKSSSHSYPPNQSSSTTDDNGGGEDSLLQSDRKIQDALSSELLRMASRLKANSLSFAEALERDRKLVESTGEKLQGNLDLMTRTRGRLGDYAKKARGLGWFTFGSILVVIFSWVLLFVVIKLT